MSPIPVELQETLKRGECILFVGSGISEGIPNWKKLMELLAAELDIPDEMDVRSIAEYYQDEFGRFPYIKHNFIYL